jgi:hypothetical protein
MKLSTNMHIPFATIPLVNEEHWAFNDGIDILLRKTLAF